MVTVVGKTAEGLGVYRGLSTDLPLDPAPKNGSRFFAMDNGKTYWYDAASDTWEGYSGGGGGGASELSDLSDVDLEGLADGDFLKYDEDLNKWVPGAGGGGGASELSDLSDVDLEGLADGDFLKYDEDLNKWVPGAGGSSGADLSKTIAPIETSNIASKEYRNGDFFIDKDGYLSIATTSITLGSLLTLNTNYIHQPLGEINGFGTLYTESPDGTKTWRTCLNNVFAFLQTLPNALRHRCQLYMNRHIYRASYDYGATVDYTADIWSNTGVSFSRMQPTTSTSTYQVKAEDGTMSNLSTAICDQIILVAINY